ncbi:5'/3'-nucleotidase SurE [Hyphobacterium marinum]|uniref:5'-nucleotidase SurE n=1 Tax=Hyphobacterium marinum TaxID=3116574 RepID=A0ABU7M1D0_9PROT|nr:5'/3'-nucleotidase SurE [Hyphobacterium sp. Y6023]MEE2567627.1 5'/3'-nucleotidase SurE [Hyphobacterium sp. Y6023]
MSFPDNPRILLTNDDGVRARGLKSLQRIAAALSDDVWTCVPAEEQSGAGRSLTLHDPLRVRQTGEREFAVTGTPTDAVLMGIQDLIPGKKPDLVLSGVNRGANIAEDVTFSGTVAGAMQGMQLGIPSIALSQAYSWQAGATLKWETAETFGAPIVRKLMKAGWPEDVLININFPDRPPEEVREVEVTRQGRRNQDIVHAEKRTDPRGVDYYWIGFRGLPQSPEAGDDLHAVMEGRISVTPLHVDLTHMETHHELRGLLGGAPPRE